MPRKPADRPNPYLIFLRRLRAGGRSNMYGAIPYLITAFGCDRNEAFRVVCEWLDAQSPPDAAAASREPAQETAVASRDEEAQGSRPARRNGRKPSRHKAA